MNEQQYKCTTDETLNLYLRYRTVLIISIGDSSFLQFLLVAGILFFVLKKLWDNRKINLAKGYLEKLKAIDWKDTKKSAYEATHYARLLATDETKKRTFFTT